MIDVSSAILNPIKYINYTEANFSIKLATGQIDLLPELGKKPVLLRKSELPSIIVVQTHKPALKN